MDTNEHQDHADDGQEPTGPATQDRRGGSRLRIASALIREPGAGLAHWGGPAPAREPVDVAGTSRPGRLPAT